MKTTLKSNLGILLTSLLVAALISMFGCSSDDDDDGSAGGPAAGSPAAGSSAGGSGGSGGTSGTGGSAGQAGTAGTAGAAGTQAVAEGGVCTATAAMVITATGVCQKPTATCEGGTPDRFDISEIDPSGMSGLMTPPTAQGDCATGLVCCLGTDQCEAVGAQMIGMAGILGVTINSISCATPAACTGENYEYLELGCPAGNVCCADIASITVPDGGLPIPDGGLPTPDGGSTGTDGGLPPPGADGSV